MSRKIIHVSAGGLNHGGVATVIFSITRSLHSKFDFGCVVFNKESIQENIFEEYGKLYKITCYPKKGKRDYFELLTRPFKLYFGIRNICKKEHFDVIHCHNQRDEWICLLAAKHAHVPIRIAHTHVTTSPKKISFVESFYKQLSPRILEKVATEKIGCSKLACEQFYINDDYKVIPNSIDIKKYSLDKREEHAGYNFIHVGRFNYAKNQEFVLEVFAEICKKIENSHLFLIGYGTTEAELNIRSQIQDLNISQYVEVLPGNQVNIPDYYAKADYMIFPSRHEGFGIALLEAQAMGIQCYVSENIQPEVDVGLLTFLQLSDGKQIWANRIVDDIKNGNEKVLDVEKLAKYSDTEVCKQYEALYLKEI